LPTFFFMGRTVIQLLGPTALLLELALAVGTAGDVQFFTVPPPEAASAIAPAAAAAAGGKLAAAVSAVMFTPAFFRPVLSFLAWWLCLVLAMASTLALLMTRFFPAGISPSALIKRST